MLTCVLQKEGIFDISQTMTLAENNYTREKIFPGLSVFMRHRSTCLRLRFLNIDPRQPVLESPQMLINTENHRYLITPFIPTEKSKMHVQPATKPATNICQLPCGGGLSQLQVKIYPTNKMPGQQPFFSLLPGSPEPTGQA